MSRQHGQRPWPVCRNFRVRGLDRVSQARSRLCRETSRVPDSARQSQMYPSRTRGESKSRQWRQHNIPFAGLLLKPSDGLEPSTPLYEEGSGVKSSVVGIAQSGRVPRW